jgi:hypothetical protein
MSPISTSLCGEIVFCGLTSLSWFSYVLVGLYQFTVVENKGVLADHCTYVVVTSILLLLSLYSVCVGWLISLLVNPVLLDVFIVGWLLLENMFVSSLKHPDQLCSLTTF